MSKTVEQKANIRRIDKTLSIQNGLKSPLDNAVIMNTQKKTETNMRFDNVILIVLFAVKNVSKFWIKIKQKKAKTGVLIIDRIFFSVLFVIVIKNMRPISRYSDLFSAEVMFSPKCAEVRGKNIEKNKIK